VSVSLFLWIHHTEMSVMATDPADKPLLEEPLAELERQLIAAYLAGAGYTLNSLMGRDDAEARQLLINASVYASDRLSEIEARSHYFRELHGTP